MRKSNWNRASGQLGAWILPEGQKGGMRNFGLVPKDQKRQEEGKRESLKLTEKLQNVKTVPSHNIHINLSSRHCCFVNL